MAQKIEPIDEKFIESYELDEWEIETESGWKDITHLHKTIKYDVWELKTFSCDLKCADDHIVMVDGFKQKFVKDLTEDDRVITRTGLQKVISVKKLELEPEEMFDVTVDSDTHTLYTNDILSHNTTVSTIYILWYILFHKDKYVAILANKEPTAIKILDRIKLAYKMIPLWMQQGIEEGGWNKKSISLGNGTKAIAASTSSDSISGDSVNLLYMDEFAKVKPHIAEEFITATYPVISSGTTSKIIIISTPTGLNHFYDFWMDAVRGKSNFFPIFVGWWEVPGRDEQWKKETIAAIGGPVRFAQEYSCKFLGSSSTLVDGDVLERIIPADPISMKWNGLFQIYKSPEPSTLYVLGIDSAKGTGKDYSVIQVLKISNLQDIEQVAMYRNNLINARDFAQVCISISDFYGGAPMMVENNDIGSSVCDAIWYEYENENLINVDPKGLGIRSHRKTKLDGCLLIKDYMEKSWLKIVDKRTIYELSRYEEATPNVFKAGRNDHDDCVTSLLWALYFIITDYFEGRDLSVKTIDDKYKIDFDPNAMPVMIFDEGNEITDII